MSARAASSGVITMFVLAPANSNGIGPDTKYLPILLAGSQFASTSGAVFSLNQSVDFADPDNEVVVASVDSDNTPTYYAVKAEGTVTSGEFVQEDITVGQFEKFLSAELTTKNITEVVAVTDSEGHSYFEVDNLSQNTIYIPVANKNDDRYTTPSIMVPVIVPRRFVLERERDRTFLQFGYGSDSETSTDSVADPTDVLMDLHGRTHVLEKSFDPTKLLSTDKFGIAPENTVLTVVARRNTATTVNAPTNTLISLVSPKFQFTDRNLLDEDKVSTVIGSLEVTNEAPIIGDSSLPEPDELKARVKAHFASQNRAVTQQDYQSLIYNLPPQFGKIKRCAIFQDPDSYRRNLNVYVLSENTDGTLVQTPETTKENLKAWIGRYKMINDTVDILDGRIVNIGINFEIIAEETIGKFEVLQNCYNTLRSLVSNRVLNMGESFSISRIYKILNAVSGVVDVVDVSLVNKTGGAYSTTPFDINSNLSSDGRQLYVPNDHVLEIKRPGSDIQGVVK